MSPDGTVVRAVGLTVLVALLAAGCAGLDQAYPSPYVSPPLHHAPGGGHVPGNTS